MPANKARRGRATAVRVLCARVAFFLFPLPRAVFIFPPLYEWKRAINLPIVET